MKNLPLLIGTLVVTLLLVIGVAVMFSHSSETQTAPVDQKLVLGDERHVRGPANAKITLVEFSDLQCPACKAMEPTVRDIVQKHPNDVRLVYRQFPLVQIHKNAQQAALLAEATTSFGKFWQMHDLLFDNQDEWADLSGNDLSAKFDSYLAKIDVDKNELKKKIGSQETSTLVSNDVSDATKLNVDATPTFYVNGHKTPAPDLVSTIDSMLSASK